MGCVIICPKRNSKILKAIIKPSKRKNTRIINFAGLRFHNIKNYRLSAIPEASSKEEVSNIDINS